MKVRDKYSLITFIFCPKTMIKQQAVLLRLSGFALLKKTFNIQRLHYIIMRLILNGIYIVNEQLIDDK
jgi:hypothetical protein